MVYTYYDYLENYYESYYDYYYEYTYWPYYYGNYNGSNTTYNGTYPPSPYEYHAPYNMDIFTPPTLTLICIMAVLSILIAIITVYKIFNSKRKNKVTIGLTMFSIVSHLTQNILDPISYYFWYIEYDPTSTIAMDTYMAWDVAWCCAKLSLYFLFIYRYWLIFKATPAADKKEKYIIFGGFVTAMLTQCGLYVVYLLYGYVLVHEKNAQRTYLIVCWAFLAIDTVLTCILGYLLIRSVLKLVITIHRLDPDRKNTPFHMTPTGTQMESSFQTSMQTNDTSTTSTQPPPASADIDDSVPPPTKMEAQITDDGYRAYESGFMDRDDVKESVPDESGYLEKPQNVTNGTHQIQLSDVALCVQQSENVDVTQANDVRRRETVASETAQTISEVVKIDGRKLKKVTSKREKRLNSLLHTATRIAVTMLISMMSSFFYQFLWLLSMEMQHYGMMYVSFIWCVDAVINMLCIYLSMSVAKRHYQCLCSDCCKFHQCILFCTEKIVEQAS